MSLIIKGSIMPLMCEECPCYDCDDYSCKATGRGVIEYRYDGRPDNCPLVEVPTPHGRLIDCERATFPTAFRYNTNDYAKGWNACIKAVQTAPTIIEAEVSEE